MAEQRVTLLLVRPYRQAVEFAAAFLAQTGLDVAVVPSPVIDVEPVGSLPDCSGAFALVFTSANAVETFADSNPDRKLRAFCVGASTAKAATKAGFRAISADGDLGQLLELLTAYHMEGDGPYIYLRGEDVAGDLAGLLRDRGVPVVERVIYRQVECPLTEKAREVLAERRVVVPLFSKSSAQKFVAQAGPLDLDRVSLVCMSRAVAEPLTGCNADQLKFANHPSRASMIQAIATVISDI
jgi:uroporphyrinogen-III synthase